MRLLSAIGILLLIVVAAGAAVGGYLWKTNQTSSLSSALVSPLENALGQLAAPLAQDISLPPPLRFFGGPSYTLTATGIITQTNTQRTENGDKPLSSSDALTRAAQNKLDDLFARQYFEHVSPDGKGPADLAEAVGYNYLRIGENLALGNFAGDAGVVDAWMKSPGHRANILAAGYTQIGVAAKEGTFQGQKVWIAVQEFGTPAAVCPTPSVQLKSQLDQMQLSAQSQQTYLNKVKAELDAAYAAWKKAYDEGDSRANDLAQQVRELQDSYNKLATAYNGLVAQIAALAKSYNATVNQYNTCAQGYK
jgi:uncharacterized protein YkwD